MISLPSISKRFLIPLLSSSLLLSACGSSDDDYFFDDPVISECSQIGQNRFVYDVMQQWYFWDDSIPVNIDPDGFASVDSLLDAMVANAPEVDRFSYITDQTSSDQFFQEGKFVGLGFTSQQIDETLQVALVFPGSPAAQAGLERGDTLLAVNGVNVAATLAAGNSIDFGSAAEGTVVNIDYSDLNGDEFSVAVTKQLTDVPTVPVSTVFDNNGVNTAYLFFYTFIEPSNVALATAFEQFQNSAATELIVDLRYNSGGLISVANYLAGLIGGTVTQNEVLSKRLHNSQNTDRNETTLFSNELDALDLQRVVFITSESTASASELIINSLEPFIDVVLIGDTTFGKPVGQYGFDFCGNTLFPVSFETVNALDQGEYFSGIAPTCSALDDLSQNLGSQDEASLATALAYLQSGSCPAAQSGYSDLQLSQKAIQKVTAKSLPVIKSYRYLDAH